MQKPLYADVIAYFEKLEKKHAYQANKAKWQGRSEAEIENIQWTIVNKKDTIFKYIFRERLDSLPIPECCFHFVWCQIA